MVWDTVLLSRGNDVKFIIWWQWFWKLLLYICGLTKTDNFSISLQGPKSWLPASSSLLSDVYSLRGKFVARPSPSIFEISPLQILKERKEYLILIKSGTHHIVAFLLTILLDLVGQRETWTGGVAELGREPGNLRWWRSFLGWLSWGSFEIYLRMKWYVVEVGMMLGCWRWFWGLLSWGGNFLQL